MKRVFSWIDRHISIMENAAIFVKNNIDINTHFGIYEVSDGWYKQQYPDIIGILEEKLTMVDETNKRFIFKRIFRNSRRFFNIDWDKRSGVKIKETFPDAGTNSGCIVAIYHDIESFYEYANLLCVECGLDPKQFHNYNIQTPTSVCEPTNTNIGGGKPYKTMARSQRIATLNQLLSHFGIKEGVVDKTIIAEFIEAITEGNATISGKDTYTYKHLGDNLNDASKLLLKKISIE